MLHSEIAFQGNPSEDTPAFNSPLVRCRGNAGGHTVVQGFHHLQSLALRCLVPACSLKEQTSKPTKPFQRSQSSVSWEFLLPWPQLRRGKGTPDETRHLYSLLAGVRQQFNFVLKTEQKLANYNLF